MTIRRRLSAAFFVIVMLFALNLIIYFWGNQRRQLTVEALRRAVSSQALISAINLTLNDIQKQITLLGQAAEASSGADPVEVAQFNQQLQSVEKQIDDLHNLAEPQNRKDIDAFGNAFRNLAASWRVFYGSFGVDQTKAITELAVRAEPLTQEVLKSRLPQLQKDENGRVDAASSNFYAVATLTDRIAIAIFLASAAIAIIVAFAVSTQLTTGLDRLKKGAALIGSGHLEERLAIKSNDELSELARAFNDMTGKLALAHDQLTRAGDQERRKSEELEKAMDQLRKAQDQLVVQEKLASLGSLTAGIAHEIKNPLNFVTNFAEVSVSLVDELGQSIAEQKQRLDPKEVENIAEILNDLQQNVSKIQQHGKRADGIVRNMLMHSRGQSGQWQLTNLNSLLSEYVKLAYHGMRAQNQNFNVGIEEDLDPSLQPVNVVAHDLSRVFLNIANNACYSAYEKKKRVGDGFEPLVSSRTRDLGSRVELRIRDNGDGIPPAVKARIFEPFFTTKPTGSGTGLGLSMSFEIVVQQHKGEIRVESEPGQFAEFIITLPKMKTT
ncbi:MAG TPA: ATP-binding protein [Terriglobia bacterium]|jgi:signal transduction histidine kinase